MSECSIVGCSRQPRGRGLCSVHHAKWKQSVNPPCSVDGCKHNQLVRGLCPNHYQMLRKHGTPTPTRQYAGRHPIHGCAMRSGASPEWRSWVSMRARCEKPYINNFHRYGGRGIKVCARWQQFENFIADMGLKPSDKHSIDRIDVDGNYEPGNCRWATATEQARNTRQNRMITVNGVTRCLAEWVEVNGLKYATVKMRLRAGWNEIAAVTTPVNARR